MTLRDWNANFYAQLQGQPLGYGGAAAGPGRPAQSRVLMHGSFIQQNLDMNELLRRVGLRAFDLRDDQTIHFDDNVPVFNQGTGLRSMLPILAALTNPNVTVILVDEPELSLEPRLQKVLRDLLIEASADKIIVVATHSHLFVRRDVPKANQVLRRNANTGQVEVHTLEDRGELYDVVFELLGSSTEDLFFPRNYVIVEGASDQEIVSKALELLGVPTPTIKVLAARGIDAVRDAVEAVYRASLPLVVGDSPYAGRVVALIDDPRDRANQNFVKLEEALRDRLYILDQPSMEEYLPPGVYAKAGRERDADIAALEAARSDHRATATLKRDISRAVAGVLTAEDLEAIPKVADAARRAIAESA